MPSIDVRCEHCRKLFPASPELAGGITNCPGCGKATTVAGLRDLPWRLIQAGVLFAALVLFALGCALGNPLLAFGGSLGVLGVGWLLTRLL